MFTHPSTTNYESLGEHVLNVNYGLLKAAEEEEKEGEGPKVHRDDRVACTDHATLIHLNL